MPNKKNNHKLSTWGKIWRIALAIAVPLCGGFIISLFTRDAMSKFSSFNQPPLAPPAWLFPVAWTILYILMGVSAARVYSANFNQWNGALTVWAVQLMVNFVWSIIFFNYQAFLFSFISF